MSSPSSQIVEALDFLWLGLDRPNPLDDPARFFGVLLDDALPLPRPLGTAATWLSSSLHYDSMCDGSSFFSAFVGVLKRLANSRELFFLLRAGRP